MTNELTVIELNGLSCILHLCGYGGVKIVTFVLINRKKNKINQFGMDLFYYLSDNTVAISTFTF